MPKIPIIKPKQLEKVLFDLGFLVRTAKGSHQVYKHPDGRRTVLAQHNRPISIGTLKAILRQIDISVEELLKLL